VGTYGGSVTEIDTGRAAFQVVVFPFRREGQGFVYALFRRQDAGYWQGVAGGGEAGESPLEAARREAAEEAGVGDGAQFVVLDARATMPVVAVTGEFSWGPRVLVIPEYAFGVGVDSAELRLSDERGRVHGAAVGLQPHRAVGVGSPAASRAAGRWGLITPDLPAR
jgi:dATP pyrophosphohydrolase